MQCFIDLHCSDRIDICIHHTWQEHSEKYYSQVSLCHKQYNKTYRLLHVRLLFSMQCSVRVPTNIKLKSSLERSL